MSPRTRAEIRPPVAAEERLLAAALRGDDEALERLATAASGTVAERHRLGPALWLRARQAGVDGPAVASWHRSLVMATARRLALADGLEAARRTLERAGLPWAPLKGLDLGDRVYDQPEQRPTGDIDLLVSPTSFPAARAALERDGWCSVEPGPRSERHLVEEAYCWQATDRRGLLLELHLRLWDSGPEETGRRLLERSRPVAGAGPERRLLLADAWIVAALHLWQDPPPRPLLSWWDLECLARAEPDLAPAVIATAGELDLALPLLLAATQARAVFPLGGGDGRRDPHDEIVRRLTPELRWPERLLAHRLARRGAGSLPLAALVAGQLLARRRSRSGWRAVVRRIWAHPGVVEQQTQDHLSWPRRRWRHLLDRLGLARRRDSD